MKRILSTLPVLLTILFTSCDKSASPAISPSPSPLPLPVTLAPSKCQLVTETTNLSGNSATYLYSYSNDGNVSSIKKFTGNRQNLPADSILVYYNHTINYYPSGVAGKYNILATDYDANIFTGLPSKSSVSITLDGIEQRNYWSYFFFYDAKNRLIKIGEQTNTVTGDLEYDLNITYNDQDNVTSLSYESTTGPKTITTITALGYDDKPSPFTGIKNWPMLMHASWSNYDPEPILSALSKNNLLGYTIPGWKRTISYSYDNQGFPVKRMSTNTTSTGSYSFEETFNFQCK